MVDTADAIKAMSSKGGKQAAASMTAKERSERASLAATARWNQHTPKATHGDSDHPLRIGDREIACYVLEDGTRILSQSEMIRALGMARGTGGLRGGDRLATFVAGDRLKPFVSSDLLGVINSPIKFITPRGSIGFGYEATALADICDAVLAARKEGILQKQQIHIAEQCEILVRSFAKTGIIALVDEATGYQYDRPRRDLEDHLKKYLSENLRRWVRTFPADYFKHLCRLRGVELRADMRLPQYFGHLTNDLVYRRIAPGLLKKLKERRLERGCSNNKLHSWASMDYGIPEILVHLGIVIGLMKVHSDYDRFVAQLDLIAPLYPESPGLFDDPDDWE